MKDLIGHGINAITLRQIRYLTATVQSGSFAAAARRLHISQPAVFAQIKQLEDLLETPLLVRHPRGIELTRSGEVFLKHARVALDELDHAVLAAVEAVKPVPAGELTLGMTPSAGKTLFVDLLRDLRQQAPGLRLLLREGLTDDLWNLVMKGELDAAFCYDPKPAASIRIRALYDEDLYLVGAREVMQDFPREIDMTALRDLKLVLGYRDHQTRDFIESACAAEDVDVSSALEVEPVAMKREMLVRHGHCSIVPFALFREEIQGGMLAARRIRPSLGRTVSLVVHRDAPASVEHFLRPAIEAQIERIIRDQALGWRRPLDPRRGAGSNVLVLEPPSAPDDRGAFKDVA